MDPAAAIGGQVRDLAPDIAGIGFVLGPALVLLYLGFALAAIAAALLLAGLAARQVRSAEALIRREPLLTAGVGLLGLFLPIVLLVLLTVTVIGAPLAFGIAFGLWPLAAFIGYLVAGIAIGDWIVGRLSPRRHARAPVPRRRRRPRSSSKSPASCRSYPRIATLFGYGAVLLLAWRTLRSHPTGSTPRHLRAASGAEPPADADARRRTQDKESDMNVLVTAASRHGSTMEIATIIAGHAGRRRP